MKGNKEIQVQVTNSMTFACLKIQLLNIERGKYCLSIVNVINVGKWRTSIDQHRPINVNHKPKV